MRTAICSVLLMFLVGPVWGQQASSNSGTVPTVIRFSGNLADANGKPLSAIVGVTFSLYKEEQGGAPLWVETQSTAGSERAVFGDARFNYKHRAARWHLRCGRSALGRCTGARASGTSARPLGQRALCAKSRGRANHWRTSALGLRAGCASERDYSRSPLCARYRAGCPTLERHHRHRYRELRAAVGFRFRHRKLRGVPVGHGSEGQDRHRHGETGVHAGCEGRKHDSRAVQLTGRRYGHGECGV